MEIEGKIIQFIGEQSGTSKAGNPWKKKEWVLETFGNYPRKVKFHIFGDKADTINLELGKDYVLSFDLESREFNGRWYTDVSVFRAQDFLPGQQQSFGGQQGNFSNQQSFQNPQPGNMQYGPSGNNYAAGASFTQEAGESDEDLPF